MTACGPAENAELVLQAHDVYVTDIQEVRCPQIGGKVLLLDLEANYFRVLVAAGNVVDRHGQTLALGIRAGHGGQQVGGKRSDAALAW